MGFTLGVIDDTVGGVVSLIKVVDAAVLQLPAASSPFT